MSTVVTAAGVALIFMPVTLPALLAMVICAAMIRVEPTDLAGINPMAAPVD